MPQSVKSYILQTTHGLQLALKHFENLVNEQMTLGFISQEAGLAKLNAFKADLTLDSNVLISTPQNLNIDVDLRKNILGKINELSELPHQSIIENQELDEAVLSLSHQINHGAEQLQLQVNKALEKAVDMFQKIGNITLDANRKVKVEVIDQLNNKRFKVSLPLMLANGQSIHYHYDLVDSIFTQTKCNATIFQCIPQGFLRIATNVTTTEDKRAINTFIPKDSPVVQAILRGETYRGSAFVVNNWHATAYTPILIDGKIEGMLYVGLIEYLPRLHQRISNVKLRKMLENLVDIYFANSQGSSAIEKLIAFFTHAQENVTDNPFVELGLKELTVLLKQIKEERELTTYENSEKHTHPLNIATEYIQKHLHESMTIEMLTKVAHTSKPSLYRYFKEKYDLSPIDFINCERLKRAVRLMDSTKKNIQTISQEVGFENTSYFIKLFHQRFGIPPKQYTKLMRMKAE